ncbi:hypothetical protein llap_20535 [Limosa lapponica baueri]|uniref:Uncharacterized protein n=1 Tax=Limosa lapponica baueri TaxID=1758121 RepID=A0A2I0T5U3_LIMLA|nr:hypothetical protein llap_20535 [Limosa lapponica baueri]
MRTYTYLWEKIWQGLPSQQSPICSKRTERQPLSEGGVRYIRSQITWLASKALASDFQTNTHLLKAEPRRKCEEGLRCGRPRGIRAHRGEERWSGQVVSGGGDA